ncbi:preprotein translocase subunit SecA [Moraxella sp. ZY210820]|uniref:preprotein translocase subunit SecA n=1 Tax=unclassified Moraxella TaxID=2685852 RepID=UPI002730576B|nr:preprotein translocase subunit SecA [Moraxella sp. ZY210820]WLF82925.1 preprotein translocase subunit SecA [Moraxella sp. ZY210820]
MTNTTLAPEQEFRRRKWISIGYDSLLMILILINLFCLATDAILMSDFMLWFSQLTSTTTPLAWYKTHLHPIVELTEHWFTLLWVTELLIHWAVSVYRKEYPRWFFYPFYHWYDVLALIPHLRFLRLFRAGIIAYKLHELGYFPKKWYKWGEFYYFLVLEELTDRIALTMIRGVERELKQNSLLKQTINDMLDKHRQLFATTLAELLQQSLGKALQQQQRQMSYNVGQIVNQAIEDTPELHQMLRLLPVIGGRLEQQIQSIGQRLGENITNGLLQPFTESSDTMANDTYQLIAHKASQTPLDSEQIAELVQSVIFDSLEIVRKQVKVKQWQESMHNQPK